MLFRSIRSRLAPATGKFDNIRYDYERHPSGVYDVPASTNTTPACTLVGAPAFSSTKVKVDIEADDEDEYEAFASKATAAPVIVPTQNVVVASKPPIKPRPKLQLLTNPSTGAYAIADVTVDVTKPPLPPRSESMVEEMARKLQQVRGLQEPAESVLVDVESGSDADNIAQTPQTSDTVQYAQILHSVSSSQSGSPPRDAPAETPADDMTSSDYYRRRVEHQPVSGCYDNNMEDLPKSPYCLYQNTLY